MTQTNSIRPLYSLVFLVFTWLTLSSNGYSPASSTRVRMGERRSMFQEPAQLWSLQERPCTRMNPIWNHPHQQRVPTSLPNSERAMSTATVENFNSSTESAATSVKSRILKYMGLGTNEDGLTLRQRLTKMGVYAAMSYNVVSQVNSGSSTSIAWFFYSLRVSKMRKDEYAMLRLLRLYLITFYTV